MRTLRSRLLLGTAAATALVLLVFCVVLYAIVSGAAWHQFDGTLAVKARTLAALVEEDDEGVQMEVPADGFPEFGRAVPSAYFQLWAGEREIARSDSLGTASLERIDNANDATVFRMITLPDGGPGRAAYLYFQARQEEAHQGAPAVPCTLVVAQATRGIERPLAQLRWLLLGLCTAAIFGSVAVLSWFVRRGLEPVGQLAAQIASVGESDLTTRIHAERVPAELMPVVQRLNELLARLEAAFARERVFTADVAHELRTPLAGLRTMLEVALSRPRESHEYQRTMTECLSVSLQMHLMVINLLNLARADARQLPMCSEPVDLGELARECWRPLAAAAEARHLQMEWDVPDRARVNTDRGKLQLVVANLLDNAVTYADEGGRISIQASVNGDLVTMSVANTGSQVPVDETAHVFERFWRGDASRSAAGQHCGLGLSLCKKLVGLLGGSIEARSEAGGTFSATVVVPISAVATSVLAEPAPVE